MEDVFPGRFRGDYRWEPAPDFSNDEVAEEGSGGGGGNDGGWQPAGDEQNGGGGNDVDDPDNGKSPMEAMSDAKIALEALIEQQLKLAAAIGVPTDDDWPAWRSAMALAWKAVRSLKSAMAGHATSSGCQPVRRRRRHSAIAIAGGRRRLGILKATAKKKKKKKPQAR